MDSFTLEKCMDVTTKLGRKTLFSIFRTKQDLKTAFPSLTKSEILNFVDLEEIAKKLDDKIYPSRKYWENDIRNVWLHCTKISTKLPLLKAIAEEFRDISFKLIIKMPNNENDMKKLKALELTKKLKKLTDNVPSDLSGAINVICTHNNLSKV